MEPIFSRLMFIVMILAFHQLLTTCDAGLGVNFGMNGDNLPSPSDVIDLYKRCGVGMIRLFEPKTEVLEALRGSRLKVALGVRNEDLGVLSSDRNAASEWVRTNVSPYVNDVSFGWITLGNEVIPGPLSLYVPGAMNNMHDALTNAGISGVQVTTVVPATALGVSYPPSTGAFSTETTPVMRSVADILSRIGSQLMINVYPYFAYASNPRDISLDYATFNTNQVVVQDGPYQYFNLLDAMVDAFNAALEKIGYGNVALAVSETGWPSAGNDPYASIANAQRFNMRAMEHLATSGTPRKPQIRMDAFFFEMFNEDKKESGVEQNFGFFYPNMQPVYPIFT